ncbi:MAG TPA: carbamoyltransferase HypF [Acidimicrobiales bacterium]|nr:carbamoyltransferase HypF [Acidimicrobiales bacterium]
MSVRRVAIRVAGVVQGVGFRPFVYARAVELGLVGLVGNDASGVFVEAQGDAAHLEQFIDALREGPALAQVDEVVLHDLSVTESSGFVIVATRQDDGVTSIPPDTAVCDECLAEMRDPTDRRFGYAFIACTNCGPRYTIVTGLPYDRPRTTMADFTLCAQCQDEYDDPRSRRFHAQPTCCRACGPQLDTDVAAIVAALGAGLVVAIKGVGGYHLACDARDEAAVARLRSRKRRGDKPFALMVVDLAMARRIVELDDVAESVLMSPARPVVLARARDASLQASVAPRMSTLGVMVAYAPVHHLLFDAGAPGVLVMTSANLADEPICTSAEQVEGRLGEVADLFVHHDRRIHVACDDSVVRVFADSVQPVRRSRGYAPLPVRLPFETPDVLAVGGELKTTICVARGRLAWMSQHVGDTESLETLGVLARTAQTLGALQGVEATLIVSDAHPDYRSRRWAEEEAQRRGVAHATVQHHHAHAASLLSEHGWDPGAAALVFAFDGTGWGADGTIWGGEMLVGSYGAVTRVGHLRPVSLPGGDAAIRRPLRSALAHLHAAGIDAHTVATLVEHAREHELDVVSRMLDTGVGCVRATSAGRLFDAVASLLNVRHDVDFEAQAAMELEALAQSVESAEPDDFEAWAPLVSWREDTIVLDTSPGLHAALAARRAGADRRAAARAFHEGLALGVARAAVQVRANWSVDVVGFTGGVFSNAVLTRACYDRVSSEGFKVLVHERVPANDGGLALGQVAVAAFGGASFTP